ncbi:DUF3857 domain-containing protein [Orrella sp. 11846]|uniref:DUF3857 domain-containing protein n=1 Tax=Orrella sp. 11846 TaxID=3409913 RepID=UPI003B594B53
MCRFRPSGLRRIRQRISYALAGLALVFSQNASVAFASAATSLSDLSNSSKVPISGVVVQQAPMTVNRFVFQLTVNSDGTSVIDRQRLITANTASGALQLSQFGDHYNQSRETLDVVEAWTENPSGEKFLVGAHAIHDVDEHNGQDSVYSDEKARMVIFSNVNVGSKVFLHTRVTTQQPLYPDHVIHEEVLDPRIPFESVDFEVIHDVTKPVFIHAPRMTGTTHLSADGRQQIHQYHFEQLEVAKLEDDSIDWHDLFTGFQVSTVASVQALGQLYAQHAQAQEVVTPEIAALAKDLTQGIEDPLEQVQAIYHWVTSQIRYVGVYLSNAAVVPHSAGEVLKNGYGDCKDHNALFVALLKAIGVDALAALVNQGDSYTLPEIGILARLNHVMTYLPKWDLFLDTTSGLLPFGVLSDRTVDKPVVLTSLGLLGRTPKATTQTNVLHTMMEMSISPTGVMQGIVETDMQGPSSLAIRSYLASYGPEHATEQAQSLLSRYLHSGQASLSFDGVWERAEIIRYRMDYALDPESNFPGPGALTLPGGLSPAHLINILMQVPLPTRQYPYVCQPQHTEEHYRIEFPKNVVITKLPDDVRMQEATMRFESHYEQQGNQVIAYRKLELDPEESQCQPEVSEHGWRLRQHILRDLRGQIFYAPA